MLEFFVSWIITLVAIRFFILENKFKSTSVDSNMSNGTKDIIAIVMSLLLTIFITFIQFLLDFLVIDSLSNIVLDLIK